MGIAVLPPLRDRYPAKDAARVAPGRATVSCRVWAGADYEDLRLEVSVVDDSEPSRDVPEELAYDLDDAEDFPPIGAEKSLTPPRKMRRGDYPELALYYLATIYTAEHHDVIYDVHLSDKFEPFAVVSATHRRHGKLLRLSLQQLADLEETLKGFRRKYSVRKTPLFTPYIF